MTLAHCERCGLPDCAWTAGPYCEGDARIKARKQFAPVERTQWPWGLRWLARRLSQQLVELEAQNAYWVAVVKKEYDNIRLVDINIKPGEFQMLLRCGVGGILVSWMLQAMKGIGANAYVEIVGNHPEHGNLAFTVAQMSGESPGSRANRYENIIRSYLTPRPIDEWHEDIGNCLFWTLDENGNPTESPYAGTPNDIRSLHVIDGRVETGDDGVLRGHEETGGKIHTINSNPFPVYATHFTRIPEASLNWRPPVAPAK